MSDRKRPSPESTAGFTLIELMVVMLLITIVLAVAIPNFDNSGVMNSTKKVSRWIIDTARTLRSEALGQQKILTLVVDVTRDRLWVTQQVVENLAEIEPSSGAFVLPSDFNIVDVQFPHQERITSGFVAIQFYPGGYSDQALIHAEYDKLQRLTFRIEPLLPEVKKVDDWISY